MAKVGRGHAWTEHEDEILRDHYVLDGVPACQRRLPGRSRGAIWGRAYHLGLHTRTPKYGADGAYRCDDRALTAAMRRIDDLVRYRLAAGEAPQ